MSQPHVFSLTDEEGVNYYKNNTRNTINQKLGISTARKRLDIKLQFRKGASHHNWITGDRKPAWLVATWNIKGTPRAKGRPIFMEYMEQRGEWVRDMVTEYVEEGRGTIPERCVRAGNELLYDFISWVEYGGMDGYPNVGKYAARKQGHFGHTTPMWASGDLMNALEVIIE